MAARVNTKFVILLSAVLVLLVAGAGVAYMQFVYKSPDQLEAEGDVFVKRAQRNAGEVGTLEGDAARTAFEKSGQQYLFAAENYRRAFGANSTDIDLLLKYIDALEKRHVDSVLMAHNVEGEINQKLLLATQLAPDRQDLLANYYQNILDKKARTFTRAQSENIYSAISTQVSDKLAVDPDNPVALKYRGIVQTLRLSQEMLFDDQRKAREDLERAWEVLEDDRQIPSYLARWHLFESQRIKKTEEEKSKEHIAEAVRLSTDLYNKFPDDMDVQLRHCEVLISPIVDRAEEARPIIEVLAAQLGAEPYPTRSVVKTASFLKALDHEVIRTEGVRGQTTQGILNAEELFRNAKQQDPLNMQFYVELGDLLKLQMKLDDALNAYRGADQLDPIGSTDAMVMTDFLHRQARYEIANIELIKAENESDPELRKQKLELADNAVKELEKVIDRTAPVYLLEGKIAMLRGRNTEAMQKIDKACELYESNGAPNVEAILLSARARQVEGQWGAASERLEFVLDTFPLEESPESEIRLRSQLAEVSINADNLGLAEFQVDRLKEIAPDSPTTAMLAAALSLKKGDLKAASAVYEGLGLAEKPQVVRNMARAHLRAGDREQAVSMLTAYVDANPTDVTLLTELLNALDTPEAREARLVKAEEAGVDPSVVAKLRIGSTPVTEANKEEIMSVMLGEDGSGPSTVASELQRATLWQRMGEPERSREAFERAKALDPENAQVILMGIEVALRDGAISKAKTLAEKVAQRNLDLAGGRFVRGKIAAAEGNITEAISQYADGLKERPIYDDGWRYLGELYTRQDPPNYDRAAEAFDTAIRQKPDNITALAGLSEVYRLQNRYGAAVDVLRNAMRFNDRNPVLVQRYLALETQYGDKGRAIELREKLAARNPKDTGNRLALAMLHGETRQTKEAERVLSELEAETGPTLQIAMARASIARNDGAADQGASKLEDYLAARGAEATLEDHLAVGRFYVASQQADLALAMYRKALPMEDPVERQATRELADYHFNLGRFDEAAEGYASLIEQPKDDEDRNRLALRLTETYLRMGEPAQAEAMLAGQPAGARVDVLKAMVAQQQGNSDAALELLDAAIARDDTIALAYLQRGLLRANSDTQGALADAERAIKLDRNLTGAFRLKAQLLLLSDRADEAITAYNAALGANPGDNQARVTLINLYLGKQDYNAARTLIAEGLRREPDNPTWVQLDARVALAGGENNAGALEKLEKAVQISPNPGTIQLLVSRYLQADRPGDAVKLLDKHPRVVAASVPMQGLRGLALAKAGNRDGAANVLARAMERSKDVGELIAVTRSANEAMGPNATIELLKIMRSKTNPVAVDLATATVLVNQKAYAQVTELLENTLATSKELAPSYKAPIDQFLALSYYEIGEYRKSETHYRSLLEQNPENLEALNNLAYLLANDLQEPTAALPLAEKAAQLAPSSAAVLDTLGWTQHLTGDHESARQTLEKSIEIQPLAPTHLHLARVYLASDLSTKARQQCLEAIRLGELNADNDSLEKARRLLESL